MSIRGADGGVLGESTGALNNKRGGLVVAVWVVVLVEVRMLVEDREENSDVFHARVHALAVEGNHSVGGIANDDARRAMVVGFALDADEREMRVRGERLDEIGSWDECGDAGKVTVEERWDSGWVGFEV